MVTNLSLDAPAHAEKKLSTALILAALTIVYAAMVSIPIHRHLWFDELITLRIAQQPTIAQMLRATSRWDLNPPLFHLLARAALELVRGNPIGVRFPSAIEFYGAGVLLFFYARRKLGTAFGLLPMLLLWYGPMSQYATEARPYAALCFWFCALLLLWDTARKRRPRGWVLAAIAICSIGLLASHVFGTLTIFAFLCAELVCYFERRETDWALWMALFAPLVLTALYVPLFASYGRITEYPSAFQASPRKLGSFYWHNFTGVALCLGVMVAAVAMFRSRRAMENRWPAPLDRAELALFAAQVLLPVLLTVLFLLQHGAFWGRYCITSIVALCFLSAYAAAQFAGASQRAGAWAAAACALLLLLHGYVWPLWQARRDPMPRNAAVLENVKPDLPLATASGMTFVEMGEYESPRLQSRLYYLQDQAAAARIAHASMFHDLGDFQQFFHLPGRVVPYGEFLREHNDFLVLATPGYPEDWLLRKLSEDGASITRVGSYRIPYKDQQVFEVRVGVGK